MMIHDDDVCWTSMLLMWCIVQGHFESGGIDKVQSAINILLLVILSHSVEQKYLKVLGDCEVLW